MTWLEMYHEYTKEAEPIKAYHEWAALFCISSALSTRCWTNIGFEMIYPNLYVVLVGPPGDPRKSATIRIAGSLLNPIFDEMLLYEAPHDITAAKLVTGMVNTKTMIEVEGSPYEFMGSTAMCSEIGTFIKAHADDLVRFLIELYDGRAKYEKGTMKDGTKILKNVSLNMLAATTPSFFEKIDFSENVANGFSSRVIFQYAETRRFNKMFPEYNLGLKEKLVNGLRKLTEISGFFKLSPECKEYCQAWYESLPLRPTVIQGLIPYYGRKQTHVRKIAMLCTAMDMLNGAPQVTEIKHIEEAKKIINRAEERMGTVFKKTGRVAGLKDINDIKETVKNANGWIAYGDIVRKHHYDISMDPNIPGGIQNILDNLVNTLKVIERKTEGKQHMYKWKGNK